MPLKLIDKLSVKGSGITDRDTIKVLVDNKQVKVRLEGIDAPETKQAFSKKSKDALSKLVFRKTVTVRKTGEDRYGRTLGIIMVGDVNVNDKMVEDGWAWHFKKYNDEERLDKLEKIARKKQRGLWADPNPLPPWEYRARQKRGARVAEEKPGDGKSHWLNTSSNTRHNKSCQYYNNTKRGRFCRPDEGKACGTCGG